MTMNLNDFGKMHFPKTLGTGDFTLTFDHMEIYATPEGEVKGFWLHVAEDYKPVFLPYFANGNNPQMEFFAKQMSGGQDFDPVFIDTNCKGKQFVIHRYNTKPNDAGRVYTNTSFNPNPRENTGALGVRLG